MFFEQGVTEKKMIYLWQNVMKRHDSLLIKSLSGQIERNV